MLCCNKLKTPLPFNIFSLIFDIIVRNVGKVFLKGHINQPIQNIQNGERHWKSNSCSSVYQRYAIDVSARTNCKHFCQFVKDIIEYMRTAELPHFSVASRCRCFRNLSSPKKHSQICFHFGAFGGSVWVVRSMVDVCD